MKKTIRYLLFFAISLLPACNLPFEQPVVPTPLATSPVQVVPAATADPVAEAGEHRIGIRVIEGSGEFYDRMSGEKFVPRGVNYIRLDIQQGLSGGTYLAHSTFGPGFYDPVRADDAMRKMHSDGYNVVRVFIEPTTTTSISGAYGLSSAYLDNMADFISLAKKNDMFVIFSTDWVAGSPPYAAIIDQECCDTFNSSNAVHLSASGVKASRLFYGDLVQALIERGAPLEAVFSFNISNELSFDSDQPPLNWSEGSVTLGNGQTYDMAVPADKQRIIDEGLVYYIDQVRAGILEVDPSALVGIGFFQPQAPNPTRIGDARVIRTYAAIWESTADFIDLHAYPGLELSLAQYVENYEINGQAEKPIIMGEFGGFKAAYPTAQDAARALAAWQVESCKYGFDGWLIWTWDDDGGGEMFSAMDDGEAINDELAPRNRPDPCAPGVETEQNLAIGAQVAASAWLPDSPPTHVIDEKMDSIWNSGAGSPQWIELTLKRPATISEIRLLVAQYPEGDSDHSLELGTSGTDLTEVKRFSQFTRDGDWLVYKPDLELQNVQIIRVVTLSSNSWVAWKEIQVIGTDRNN